MDFLKWYRHIFETAGEEPPESVWEGIQDELDVEAVWAAISEDLPRKGKRRKMLHMMAVAASVLALIGVGTIVMFNIGDPGTAIPVQSATRYSITPSPVDEASVLHTGLAEASEFPGVRQTGPVAAELSIHARAVTSPAFMPLYPRQPVAWKAVTQKQDAMLANIYVPPFGEKKAEGRPVNAARGYYAGMSGHLANTWLINNKTIQGLRPDEFTASLPSFGYNLGIIAGKNFGSRFGLRAELSLVSLTRQDYNEYLHGKYINNSMRFTYSNLSLSATRSFTGNGRAGNHILLLGAYSGILRNAVQDLNGEVVSLAGDYSQVDYGFITGYEYEHPLGNGLAAGMGIQARLGLNNIFAGNEIVPYYLNSTRNASINLTFSIRYNTR